MGERKSGSSGGGARHTPSDPHGRAAGRATATASDTGTHSLTHSQKTKGRKYGPLPLVAHAGAMGYFDGMVLDVAGTLLYAMTYGSRCFPTGLAAVVCDVTAPF